MPNIWTGTHQEEWHVKSIDLYRAACQFFFAGKLPAVRNRPQAWRVADLHSTTKLHPSLNQWAKNLFWHSEFYLPLFVNCITCHALRAGWPVKVLHWWFDIVELIATERQYCVNLKIMQRVFAHGMRNECLLPEADIHRVFPELDTLIDLHQAFLSSLQDRQEKKLDKSIDQIGDRLSL